jgi:outer membrane immunogenic protein
MKALATTGISLVALGVMLGAAGAADIPVVKAPEPVPNVWSWNGFYGGLNAGFASAQSDTTVTFLNTVTGAPLLPPAGSVTSGATSQSGWIGGGQIGYNFTANNWLYGVEGDFQGTSEKGVGNFLCAAPAAVGGVAPAATCLTGTATFPPGAPGTTLSVSQALNWFGTVRGRVGLLISPTAFGYITGGLGFGSVNTSGTLGSNNLAGGAINTSFSNTQTNIGWTIGSGLEARIAGTNLTAKVEYLFLDLGTFHSSVAQSAATGIPIGSNISSHIFDNIVRIGLNYKL